MVSFPLLLIPLAIYNIIVFLMPGVSLEQPVVKVPLISGAEWPLTLGEMLLTLGILLLLLELIKGARPGAKYLTDHFLSLIVFGGAAAEFLLWPRFASSTLKPFSLCGRASRRAASAASRKCSSSAVFPSKAFSASRDRQGLVPTPPKAMRMRVILPCSTLATTAADAKANS